MKLHQKCVYNTIRNVSTTSTTLKCIVLSFFKNVSPTTTKISSHQIGDVCNLNGIMDDIFSG